MVIPEAAQTVRRAEAGRPGYIPLFWRIFIPNATVLGAAGAVLAEKPANGRELVLATGFVTLLAINLLIMRRSFSPLARLASLMRAVDPLEPGQRVPVLGPESEVTLVADSFNEMLDRLEFERRDSARRESSAQEAERRHIARELHDELGQRLTALALQLDRMAAGTAGDQRAAAAGARDAALGSVELVRSLAKRLRPEILDELGLSAALTALCRRIADGTGLSISTHLDLRARLDPDTELAVYRVVQESLTNVVRHASASQASVTLSQEPGAVVATISDDGTGIPGDAAESGIRQMRERALLVGGRLDLVRRPEGGTLVELRLPDGGSPRGQ